MTSDTPAGRRSRVFFRRRRSAPSRARRRVGAALRMMAALALAGGVYTAFTPGAYAEDDQTLSAAAQEGKALFNNSCITCHGINAQGVEGPVRCEQDRPIVEMAAEGRQRRPGPRGVADQVERLI